MNKRTVYLMAIIILIPTLFLWEYIEADNNNVPFSVVSEVKAEVGINPSHILTYELIDLLCNKEQYNELSRLYCINRLWIETKTKSTCDERKSTSRSNHILQPIDSINTGGGCCRDSVKLYSWFADEWNLSCMMIAYEEGDFHAFLRAKWLDGQGHVTDYVLIDQGHFKYVNLGRSQYNMSQQYLIKQDVKEFVALYEVQ